MKLAEAVAKLNPLDDFLQAVPAVEFAPSPCDDIMSLKAIASPVPRIE